MNFDKYIGLEFAPGGRGPDEYDCWGLLALVYREQFGITLESFSDKYTTIEDDTHIASLIADNVDTCWKKIPIEELKVGDGVMMMLRGYPRHVGIYAGHGKILHIETASGSILESISSPRISKRIEGYYRYERSLNESVNENSKGT